MSEPASQTYPNSPPPVKVNAVRVYLVGVPTTKGVVQFPGDSLAAYNEKFTELHRRIHEQCPGCFLFAIPSFTADHYPTFHCDSIETYIGCPGNEQLNAACISKPSIKSEEGKWSYTCRTPINVESFWVHAALWQQTTAPVSRQGLKYPLLYPYAGYGGKLSSGEKLNMSSFRLQGTLAKHWLDTAQKNFQTQPDNLSGWVNVANLTMEPILEFNGVTPEMKSLSVATFAKCSDNAMATKCQSYDGVTAFGNLRVLQVSGVERLKTVLEAHSHSPVVPEDGRAAAVKSKKRSREEDGVTAVALPLHIDEEYMDCVICKLTTGFLDYSDSVSENKKAVVMAIPEHSLDTEISERVFHKTVLRYDANVPTYILVPVLINSVWSVVGLYVLPTRKIALRLYGTPCWGTVGTHADGVVEAIYRRFVDALPVTTELPPTLEEKVSEISCSMYPVSREGLMATGLQGATGESVIAMLMAQTGIYGVYENLPLACDFCQKQGIILRKYISAFYGSGSGSSERPNKSRATADAMPPPAAKPLVLSVTPTTSGKGSSSGKGRAAVSRSIGLCNIKSTTCYMNAVLVSLMAINPIHVFLQRVKDAVKDGATDETIRTGIQELGTGCKIDSGDEADDTEGEDGEGVDESKSGSDDGDKEGSEAGEGVDESKSGIDDDDKVSKTGEAASNEDELAVIAAVMWCKAYDKVISNYHNTAVSNSPVNMLVVLNAFKNLGWYKSMQQGQQDSAEFMMGCLSMLETTGQWAVRKQIVTQEYFTDMKNAYTSVISNKKTCESHINPQGGQCSGINGNTKKELHVIIPLELVGCTKTTCVSLEAQYVNYLKQKSIDDNVCRVCYPEGTDIQKATEDKKFQPLAEEVTARLSEYVILQLKRFKFIQRLGGGVVQKITANVPTILHVNLNNVPYDVISCTTQTGSKLTSGHYIALSKIGDSMVYFNDDMVEIATPPLIKDTLNQAYTYVLKRQDAGVGVGVAAGDGGGRARRIRRYASLL